MIDKLQAHYGFTRMPFGRDLAPAHGGARRLRRGTGLRRAGGAARTPGWPATARPARRPAGPGDDGRSR
jgi:hypothetical protein